MKRLLTNMITALLSVGTLVPSVPLNRQSHR